MSVESTQSSSKEQKPQIDKKQSTDQAQRAEKPEQQHIPEQAPGQGKNMDKLLNKVPNMAPAGALGTETKGMFLLHRPSSILTSTTRSTLSSR